MIIATASRSSIFRSLKDRSSSLHLGNIMVFQGKGLQPKILGRLVDTQGTLQQDACGADGLTVKEFVRRRFDPQARAVGMDLYGFCVHLGQFIPRFELLANIRILQINRHIFLVVFSKGPSKQQMNQLNNVKISNMFLAGHVVARVIQPIKFVQALSLHGLLFFGAQLAQFLELKFILNVL